MRREIPGYEGLYAVSDNGVVWSLQSKKPLKPQVSTGGYLKVMLYRNGNRRWAYVHRLVAEAFNIKPDGCDVVNHIDANPQNNCAKNLEWVSQSENIAHSRLLGNQNKDKAVVLVDSSGVQFEYVNMRSASTEMFGTPSALRSRYRRKGAEFTYRGYSVRVLETKGVKG